MDAAANNAGGVGPGAYVIITSMGSIPAGAHGVVERYDEASGNILLTCEDAYDGQICFSA